MEKGNGVIVLCRGREQHANCLHCSWTESSSPPGFSQVERYFRRETGGGEVGRRLWWVNPWQCGSIGPTLLSRMGTHMWGCWSICRADVGRGFLTPVELPAHSSLSVLGQRLTLMCFSTLWSWSILCACLYTEIPLAASAGIAAKRGSVSGPWSIQSSWKESQKSHFCIRSSWDLDLFLLLYSKLRSIQKLFSILWCWCYQKRLPRIISCLMHLAALHMFGNLLFNLQLQSGLFSEKMQISLQRVFLSKNLFERV